MTLRTCDRISEQIHLLVDRELGPAETVIVEKHLQTCARCQIVAARIERMSSVLKAWEADTYERSGDPMSDPRGTPAMRLHKAVLSRVAQQGATRRREDRVLKLIHYATAASVLVALGLATWLGLRAAGSDEAVAEVALVDAGPTPLEARRGAPVDLPALAGLDGLPEGVDLSPRAPDGSEPDLTKSLLPAQLPVVVPMDGTKLALFAKRMQRIEEFSERLGLPGMAILVPRAEGYDERLLSPAQYAFLYEHKYLQKWHDTYKPRTSPTVEPGAPADEAPLDTATGLAARDVLEPLPGLHGSGGVKPLFDRPAIITSADLNALAIPKPPRPLLPLASGPLGGATEGRFIDAFLANVNEQLRLTEGAPGSDSVIAFAEGNALPIFLPAGQLLTGGRADRVVAQPVWLPPTKGRSQPYEIPCRVVENQPAGNPAEAVTVTEFMAGPTIRALLAAEGSPAEVMAAAKRQRARIELDPQNFRFWTNWSLLDVYAGKSVRDFMQKLNVPSRWRGSEGFVAVDAQGRLVGLEIVRLRGADAHLLLTRLWTSYAIEDSMRRRGAQADTVAAPGEGLERAVARLATHDGSLRTPKGFRQVEGARASSVDIESIGVRVHALEVGGRPTVVSAVSSATR